MEKKPLAHKADFFAFLETIKDDRTDDMIKTTSEGITHIISGPETATRALRGFVNTQ